MTRLTHAFLSLLLAAGSTLVTGCAAGRPEAATMYDFGPMRTAATTPVPSLPPISIAEIQVPAWLDSTMIFFRLNYANDQQVRPYAQARWTMTPAQLLAQRLKSRIAQAGGIALSAADGATNVPLLRIEADDFTQTFETAEKSSGQVALRASVFKGRTIIAQKTFMKRAPSTSPDAAGGASALAAASDAAIAELIAWLGTLPLK